MWTIDGVEYGHRKKITVQHANIDGDLTDFPVLVKIDADEDIGGNTNEDGHDVRFTDSDGETLLKYERESHTVDAGSLDATYWVKIPNLYSSPTGSQNQIYIYYREDDTTDGEDASNVWDSNFKMVQHMSESSGSLVDSTDNDNDLGSNGSPSYSQTGKVYDAIDFEEGNSDYFYISDASQTGLNMGSGDFTISGWIKEESLGYYCILIKGTGGAGEKRYVMYIYNPEGATNYFRLHIDDNTTLKEVLGDTKNLTAGTWYYFTGVRDGNNLRLYLNGASDADPTDITDYGDIDDTGGFYLGADNSGGTKRYFDGLIDEVRISNIARSADWIKFEYYNIAEADNELTWGSEEEPASGAAEKVFSAIF